MCGGAGGGGAPPRKEPPPPEPPAELVLDSAGKSEADARRRQRKGRAGRSALVTPGLSLGGLAAQATVSGLGLGSRRASKRR